MVEIPNKNNFKDFRHIIEKPNTKANIDNTYERYWHDFIDMSFFSKNPLVSYLETKKVLPLCKSLICFFYNSEAYINLGNSRLVIFAAPSKGKYICDEERIKAYLINPGQSVVISKGVWHFAPFPLDENNEFLAIVGKKNVLLDENGGIILNPSEVIETTLENEYLADINDLRF